MYPQAQVMVDESSQFPSGYSKFKYHDGFQRGWDNHTADGTELVEFYDEEGTYVFLPDTKQKYTLHYLVVVHSILTILLKKQGQENYQFIQ